jgi:arabinose-5-phosphate isomerase
MLKLEELPLFDQSSTFRHVMLELTSSPVGVAFFVDSDGRLEGILTDGDIRRILAEADFSRIDGPAYPLINTASVTVGPDAPVGEVLALMEERKRPLNSVGVLDVHSVLLGLIRVHDILK